MIYDALGWLHRPIRALLSKALRNGTASGHVVSPSKTGQVPGKTGNEIKLKQMDSKYIEEEKKTEPQGYEVKLQRKFL